jgi:hypothetical protein
VDRTRKPGSKVEKHHDRPQSHVSICLYGVGNLSLQQVKGSESGT